MAGAKSNKTREGRAGKWRNICPYQSQVSVKDFPVYHCNWETKRSRETELPHGFTGNSVGRAESLFLIKEQLQLLKPQDTVWTLKGVSETGTNTILHLFYSLLIKIYRTEIVLSFFSISLQGTFINFHHPTSQNSPLGFLYFFPPLTGENALIHHFLFLPLTPKIVVFNLGMWIWNNLGEKLGKDLTAQGHKIWRTHSNSNVSRLNRIMDSRNSWNKKL